MTRTASHLAVRPRTSARRVLAAVALAATTALAASPAAQAAGPPPNFQMPFTCGQEIMATTYSNHGPDPDSIDMWHLDKDKNNISSGEPILASADGVVTDVSKNGVDEFQVFLDHGNGWTTQHKHLESLPPLKVGQAVAQGEQIGRLGNSGIQPIQFHLHYTQLEDGSPVRIQFNGSLINTYAGNTGVYGAWLTKSGEMMTSNNCPGRAFMPFQQGGLHLYAYEAARGAAAVATLKPGGFGVTNPWSTDFGDRQWTHFASFAIGSEQRFISYASATGKVEFNSISTAGPKKLSAWTWGKGWTHVTPLSIGGQPYYIAYSSLTGARNIDRINASGTDSTTVMNGAWTQGWSQLVPFKLSGVQHVLLYKGGTGEVRIIKITGSGDNLTISNVWSSIWSRGWTHIVPMPHNGAMHMLRYKQATGLASYERVDAAGQGIQTLGSEYWTKNWSTMSPFSVSSQGHVLVYRTTGLAKMLKLNPAGTDMSVIHQEGWTTGLA